MKKGETEKLNTQEIESMRASISDSAPKTNGTATGASGSSTKGVPGLDDDADDM